MTRKAKVLIMVVISCCALISVGFANWAITNQFDFEEDTNGSIGSESVFYSSDYIDLVGEPEMFVYTYRGFKSKDDEIGHNDTITVQYKIDLANCRNIYYGSNNVVAELSVGFTETPEQDNVFESDFVSASVEFDKNNVITWDEQEGVVKDGGVLYVNLGVGLNTADKEVNVTVTYTFDLGTYENYFRYIYQQFSDTGRKLVFSATLMERE